MRNDFHCGIPKFAPTLGAAKCVIGQMNDSGRTGLQNTSGKSIELMKLTCYKCGYTVLFDMEAAKKIPYDDSADEEIFPE